MHFARRVSFSLLSCALVLPALAASKKDSPDPRSGPFPQGVFGAIDGSSRFGDPQYFKLFMQDGIRNSDPKILYSVIETAVSAKESYKALYLARIFTSAKPEMAAGWTNRAAIANSLGLKDEAAASALHAADPASQVQVPLSVLPGSGLKVRPVTLSDWAAAMALVGDSLAAHGGDRDLVAVRDDISGVAMADPNEVQSRDQSFISAGLTPTGPWATAKPLQVDQVGANLFVLKDPHPMSYATVKKAKMFGAFAMAMAAGYTGDATSAVAAGQMAGDAMEVDSNYKGGSYEKGTFGDGPKMLLAKDTPKSSGKDYAIGNPKAILWSSGPSFLPSYYGRWDTKKNPSVTMSKAGPWDPNGKTKAMSPPQLYYPRLMSFCDTNCSKPLSAMETILTPSDVSKLAPGLQATMIDLEAQRKAYLAGKLTVGDGNAGDSYVGFDDKGAIYKISLEHSQPSGWLVEP